MPDCLFCKIAAKEIPANIVYEDQNILAFHDINPKAKVHLLMIPKVHVDSLAHLEQEHDVLIAHMMRTLPNIAQQFKLDSGFRTIINTGSGGGQIIFHLHIHLLGGDNLPSFE